MHGSVRANGICGVFIDGQIDGLSTGIIMEEVLLYQLAMPEEQCALFYLILEHFC